MSVVSTWYLSDTLMIMAHIFHETSDEFSALSGTFKSVCGFYPPGWTSTFIYNYIFSPGTP